MGERVDALDRLSALPPFIIHNIMSYLSTKEVAKTSLLSHTWKELRTSFPILDFDQTLYTGIHIHILELSSHKRSKLFSKELEKFQKFVDDSLNRFCGCGFHLAMQKFRLFISLLDLKKTSPLVDKWIGLAVEKDAKEFDVRVITHGETLYTLPQSLFSAKGLATLKLAGCKLDQPSNTIKFRSLKALILERVCINEQTVCKIISECPLLEDLSLSDCLDLKRICVSESCRLKNMNIFTNSYELESVQVVVPTLQELTLSFNPDRNPRVIDLAESPHLKTLALEGVNFTDQKFHQFILKFPMLEDLLLFDCKLLERIIISGNRLKSLQFSCCANLKALDVDTPNLLSFTYSDNSIPTSTINAPCPWEVSFVTYNELNTQWCLNLREFLGVSTQIEVLTIAVSSMSSYNLEEFKESCHLLPCRIGSLELYIEVSVSDYMIMLDCLFWICYPKTLCVQTEQFAHHQSLKWLYYYLKNRDVNCCSSHRIKCWRHYLRDVRYESFLRFEDGKLLNVDELMEEYEWPILPNGKLQLHLDWCFHY